MSNLKKQQTTKEKSLEEKLNEMRLEEMLVFLLTNSGNKDLCSSFSVKSHYDTYLAKSTTKVLHSILSDKYGEDVLMVVDESVELAGVIERIRLNVKVLPELVNRTINTKGLMFIPLNNEHTTFLICSNLMKEYQVSIEVFIVGDKHEEHAKNIKRLIAEVIDSTSKISDNEILDKFHKLNFKGRGRLMLLLDDIVKIPEYTEEISLNGYTTGVMNYLNGKKYE